MSDSLTYSEREQFSAMSQHCKEAHEQLTTLRAELARVQRESEEAHHNGGALIDEIQSLRSQLAQRDREAAAMRHAIGQLPEPAFINLKRRALSSTSGQGWVRREVLEKCLAFMEYEGLHKAIHGDASLPGCSVLCLVCSNALALARAELKRPAPTMPLQIGGFFGPGE